MTYTAGTQPPPELRGGLRPVKDPHLHTYRPSDAVRWGTPGRPVTSARSRTLDPESGAERTTGTPGEIVLKRRGGALGYWKKPEATAKTLRRLLKNET